MITATMNTIRNTKRRRTECINLRKKSNAAPQSNHAPLPYWHLIQQHLPVKLPTQMLTILHLCQSHAFSHNSDLHWVNQIVSRNYHRSPITYFIQRPPTLRDRPGVIGAITTAGTAARAGTPAPV